MTWSSVTIMFTRCFPSARHWAKYWDASLDREPWGVRCRHQLTSEEAKWSTAWCPDMVRGGPSARVRTCHAPGKAGGAVPGTRRAPWRQLCHPGGSAPRGSCSCTRYSLRKEMSEAHGPCSSRTHRGLEAGSPSLAWTGRGPGGLGAHSPPHTASSPVPPLPSHWPLLAPHLSWEDACLSFQARANCCKASSESTRCNCLLPPMTNKQELLLFFRVQDTERGRIWSLLRALCLYPRCSQSSLASGVRNFFT